MRLGLWLLSSPLSLLVSSPKLVIVHARGGTGASARRIGRERDAKEETRAGAGESEEVGVYEAEGEGGEVDAE